MPPPPLFATCDNFFALRFLSVIIGPLLVLLVLKKIDFFNILPPPLCIFSFKVTSLKYKWVQSVHASQHALLRVYKNGSSSYRYLTVKNFASTGI